jgi:hypothetical protein
MDFSLTRQEKCDLLKQVASTGSFDCIGKENHINLDFDSLGSSGSSSQQPALQPQQTAPASDPWGEFTGAK